MSLERRNLDFAFPAFAPGLPSVYERAGFDVRHPAHSVKSARSKGSSYQSPKSAPQVSQPIAPPMPLKVASSAPSNASIRSPVPSSAPSPAPEEAPPAASAAPPVAPPRAPSRANRPLHIAANSAASLASVHSSHQSTFSRGGSQSSSGSQDTQNTSQGDTSPVESFTFQNPASHFDFSLPTKPGHLSCSSSVYSMDSPALGNRVASFAPSPRAPALALPASPTLACPYPRTPDAETFGFNPPPKAPNHARRASQFNTEHREPSSAQSHQTHSSSSSESTNVGACRGCAQVITGRSVYSKDGNMTGRWHKQCFKCTGCAINLKGEVYVLNDSPFCQECYHYSNKTLCASCALGIEGPCLENDAARFHPECLKCNVCQTLLQDYYEANGRTYCEAHGAHAHQARKRTTRFVSDFL